MAKMRECPVCGIRVKVENLEAHLKKVHPRVKVEASLTEEDKTAIKIARKKEKKRMAPFEEREKKRWAFAGIIVVVLVIVVVILLSSFTPSGPECDLEGEEMIFFQTGDVQGNSINLDDLVQDHELVVLEFFQTGCVPCQNQAPIMHYLHEYSNYTGKVKFVSISSSQSDTVDKVREFRDDYKINGVSSNMTYISGSGGQIASDYCVYKTPTFIFIDEDGIIVKVFEGGKGFDEMVSLIDPFLQD